MKTKYRFYLILFSITTTYAQHVSFSGKDEFTKEFITQINATKSDKWKGSDNIAKGLLNYIFLSLRRIDQTNILQLDIQTGTTICISNSEDKIILLLENDDTIQLKQASKIDCSTRVLAKYLLHNHQIKTLSEIEIKKFRIYTPDGYIDFEVKDDKRNLIKKTFSLLQSKT